ncbi:MAG: ABC transporter permease [Clostridiales bacterium]|nr:ABC transporter permease [Clostridiales bacterium]
MFLNFLKAEGYRASKMKCIWILPIIMFCLVLLTSFVLLKVDMLGMMGMSREDMDAISEQGASAEGLEDSFRAGFSAGVDMGNDMVATAEGEDVEVEVEVEQEDVSIIGEGLLYREDVPELFYQNIATLSTILLLAIFTGLFVGDVYSTGVMKNITIGNRKRGLLFTSRMTVIAIYSFLFHVVTYIWTLICVALMAESVKLNADGAFFKYFFFSWIITFAFCLVVAAVTTLTRSKAAGITVGVILASGLLTMAISIANMILVRKFGLDDSFSLANYTLTQNLAVLNLHSEGHDVARALMCSFIYGILAFAGGFVINKKRDIS